MVGWHHRLDGHELEQAPGVGGGLVAKSCLTLAIPWTVDHQAPLYVGFSRQEYYSGVPFPSPGDLPNPGIEPRPSASQADSLPTEPPGKPGYHLGFWER